MNAPVQLSIDSSNKELSLNGVCQYTINNDQMIVDVEEIASNRNSGNTSGTLTLEVWALEQPYAGDNFCGYQLATQTLGELKGQHLFRDLHYVLSMKPPVEGRWYLVMMLRERDCNGWVVRDYINFPYTVKAEYKLALSLF
ncbi:MAG: hypothetical protein HWE39_08560 [Oceanospirillaceae bacterium]|nr:hypothetical protein [Oceanospirillaceae bacterium]